MIEKAKRKENHENDYVPIPIQFFFWNQTGLFIKHRFGNLTESHAMNFERVLVQNIRHGLSPGLSDAINSISRWKLLQTALPYITHACYASLFHKKNQISSIKLGKADKKLINTLNWLLSDSFKDLLSDQNINDEHTEYNNKIFEENFNNEDYFNIYSVSMLQLFIYFFIPIIKTLHESDLCNLTQNNGLKIWNQLWNYQQPDIAVFNTPINFKSKNLKHLNKKCLIVNSICEEKCTSIENNKKQYLHQADSEQNLIELSKKYDKKRNSISKSLSFNNINKGENLNDVLNKNTEINSSIIVENEEYEMKNENNMRLSNLLIKAMGNDVIDGSPILNKAPLVHMNSICSFSSQTISAAQSSIKVSLPTLNDCQIELTKSDSYKKTISKDYSCKFDLKSSEINSTTKNISKHTSATYFDIALIRCIFNSKWHSEGYLWSLEYLHNRISQIADEIIKIQEKNLIIKKHSQSFPGLIPSKNKINFLDQIDYYTKLNVLKNPTQHVKFKEILVENLINDFKFIDEEPYNKNENIMNPYMVNSENGIYVINSINYSHLKNKVHTNLIHRSLSDKNIYYKDYNHFEELIGCAGLANKDGTIDLHVILKSVHAINYKENSIKICELTLNILDILLNFEIIPINQIEKKSLKFLKNPFLKKTAEKNIENFGLIMNIILKNIKWLSCPYCRCNSQQPLTNENLRNKIKLFFIKLEKKNHNLFEQFLKKFVEESELEYIFQTIHALLAYCLDQHSNLIGSTKCVNVSSTGKTSSHLIQNDEIGKIVGFNFFDRSLSSLIIKAIIKPLLKRVYDIEKSILNQENIYLQIEIRIFINFLREYHRDFYHRIIFSSMLEPVLKYKQKMRKEKADIKRNKITNRQESNLNDYKNSTFGQNPETYNSEEDKDNNDIHCLDLNLLVEGLNFYRLLLEFSSPASTPHISFMAVIRELEAPIVSKIAFLSETSYFINQCNKNGLPEWFKTNVSSCRTFDSITYNKNMNKKTKNCQIMIADIFQSWGEVLANNLEGSLDDKRLNEFKYLNVGTFIDEVFFSLESMTIHFDVKMIMCALLLEISSFMREVHPQILKRTKGINQNLIQDKNVESFFSVESGSISALNDTFLPNESHFPNDHENHTTFYNPINNENETGKHISFAFQEEQTTSEYGYNQGCDFETKNNVVLLAYSNLTSKSKNCQSKRSSLKQPKKASIKSKMERPTRRKHSHNNQISEIREQDITRNVSDAESIVNNIILPQNEILYDINDELLDTNKCFPWIKTILKLLEIFKYDCNHLNCHENCFFLTLKRCRFSMEATLRLYEYSQTLDHETHLKEKGINTSVVNTSTGKKTKDTDRKISIISLNSLNVSHINNFLYHYGFFYGQIRNNIKILQKSNLHSTAHYLKKQIQNFMYTPLELLCKCAVIIDDGYFNRIIKIAWSLLLYCDEEITSSAVTLFLICGIKQPNMTEEFINKELKSECGEDRFKAILKFEAIWKFRYHVWPHLESNANSLLKVTPPCIEFILPSPSIGQTLVPLIDPPWLPKSKKKIEEEAVNHEEIRAVVTTSKSRKKYQQDVLNKALKTEEKTRRLARENCNITATAYLNSASYEPLIHQNKEEQSEGNDEFTDASYQIDIILSQPVFPTSLASAIFPLIDLLYDNYFGKDMQLISDLSEKVIRNCLIDDSPLFLRYFFEKITQKDKKDIVLFYMRRLLNTYQELPVQTAYIIFNHLLGIVMFYGRTPCEGSQETISNVMNLLWRIVPNVNGIIFRDLKQILKKEQCDPLILITAIVPGAKKLIIHGPDLSQIPTQLPIQEDTRFSYVMQESFDFFSIPENKREKYYLFDVKSSQIHLPDTYVRDFYFFRRNYYPQLTIVSLDSKDAINLLEKTAFSLKVLEQSKVLFFLKILENVPHNQIHSIGLCLLEELNKIPTFPRKALEADFNLYSKLSDRELSTMDLLHKYSWVKLIWTLFSTMDSKTASISDITIFLNVINGAFVLHCEDLNMLRSCLAVYINIVKHFKQIFSTNGFLLILPNLLKVYSNMQTNQILKNSIEFVCSKFYIMHRIPFLLQLFASISQNDVVNEKKSDRLDSNKIQSINLFSLLIGMEKESKDELKIIDHSIFLEKNCNKSWNKLNNNRKFEMSKGGNFVESNFFPVEAKHTNLNNQIAYGTTIKDMLNSNITAPLNSNLISPSTVLTTSGMLNTGYSLSHNMVNKSFEVERSNIKPLDFCYSDVLNDKFAMIDAINLCVTVVAYATHASRAYEMLVVLESLLPQFMEYLKAEADSIEATEISKIEYDNIYKISLALKTMVISVDVVTRVFYIRSDSSNTNNKNSNSCSYRSPSILPDEDSMRYIDEKRSKLDSDEKKQKNDLYLVRDLILKIVSDFIYGALQRFKEFDRNMNNFIKILELLDIKACTKLAEIAHCLLKHTDESVVYVGVGLQNYFQKLMPLTDWTHDELKSTFINLLRRIDRNLKKLFQRALTKKMVNWNSSAQILYGLCLTIENQDSLIQLPFFKVFINSAINLILNENIDFSSITQFDIDLNNHSEILFYKQLIKLIGSYISSIKDQKTLECLFTSLMTGGETQNTVGVSYLISFLIPLLLWNSTKISVTTKLNQYDISFAISIILSSVKISSKALSNLVLHLPKSQFVDAFDASFNRFQNFQSKSIRTVKEMIGQSAFLGLKIINCDSIENTELQKIALTIVKISSKVKCSYLWKFFDHICTYRNPLFLLTKPIIETTIATHCFENEEDFKISKLIRNKLDGLILVNNKSKVKILNEISLELESMKKDFQGDRNTITVKNENFKNNEKELNRISDNSRFDEVLKKVSKTIDCELSNKTYKKFEKVDGKKGSIILETYKKILTSNN